MASWPASPNLIGKPTRHVDGPLKASGRAKYTYDIVRPGMIYGRVLRSPHPHARVVARGAGGAATRHAAAVGGMGERGGARRIDGQRIAQAAVRKVGALRNEHGVGRQTGRAAAEGPDARQRAKHVVAAGVETLPGVGQVDASTDLLKQWQTDGFGEFLDLHGCGRLGHVQFFRGAGEALQAGGGLEYADGREVLYVKSDLRDRRGDLVHKSINMSDLAENAPKAALEGPEGEGEEGR